MSLEPVVLNALQLAAGGTREPALHSVFLAPNNTNRPRDIFLQNGVSYLRSDYPDTEKQFFGTLVSPSYTAGGSNFTAAPSGSHQHTAAYGNTVLVWSSSYPTTIRRNTARGTGTWTDVTVTAFTGKTVMGFRYFNGAVVAACSDGSILRSTDDAQNWSLVASLGAISGHISLHYDGENRWFIMYVASGATGPSVRTSTDNAATWGAPVVLDTGSAGNSCLLSRTSLASDGKGNLVAIWYGLRSGQGYYHYSYSANYGANFSGLQVQITDSNQVPSMIYQPVTGVWFRYAYQNTQQENRLASTRTPEVPSTFNAGVQMMGTGSHFDFQLMGGRYILSAWSSSQNGNVIEKQAVSVALATAPFFVGSFAVEGSTFYVTGLSNITNAGRYEFASQINYFTTTGVMTLANGSEYGFFMRAR